MKQLLYFFSLLFLLVWLGLFLFIALIKPTFSQILYFADVIIINSGILIYLMAFYFLFQFVKIPFQTKECWNSLSSFWKYFLLCWAPSFALVYGVKINSSFYIFVHILPLAALVFAIKSKIKNDIHDFYHMFWLVLPYFTLFYIAD